METAQYIEGFAYSNREVEEVKRRSERYRTLAFLRPYIIDRQWQEAGVQYYQGKVPPGQGLTPEDIALICDHGSVCFGGQVSINDNGGFFCKIWTD